jgi:replicative DNA helicase
MNTENALIQLLLNDPKQVSALAAKGFNSKFFREEKYGKSYDLIFDRWTRFTSLPTNEDLESVNITRTTEEIPHTIDHCVALMFGEKIKQVVQETIVKSGQQLLVNGPDASIDIMRAALQAIPLLDNTPRSREISETTDAFLERFHNRALHKDEMIGLATGFDDLDKHVRGLMPQWLVVIQGRNGQFKSWILAHWINTMFLQKKNIALFSCEMTLEEFETRIHSLALGIPPRNLDLGDITSGEYNRLIEYLQEVKSGKVGGRLVINDNPHSLESISAEIDEILQKHSLDAICIDAVYELDGPGGTERERFANIAKGCKMMAKKYNIPVIVTIQANRDFAKANPSAKKETSGSGTSAYGSDAWNQVCDLMFILHRTPDHAPFHFSEFVMDKFRHGEKIDYMLKINLKDPIIQEVNHAEALLKMKGENPVAQEKSDNLFSQTSELFHATIKNEFVTELQDEETTEENV